MPIGKKAKKNEVAAELMPKRYRINRNATIWSKYHEDKMTVAQIAEAMQISKNTVRNVIYSLDEVMLYGKIENYFKLAYDICDEIAAVGKNPDKYLSNIVNSLWYYGITSPAILKKMGAKDFKELIASERIQRYPNTAPDVLKNYKNTLKAKK